MALCEILQNIFSQIIASLTNEIVAHSQIIIPHGYFQSLLRQLIVRNLVYKLLQEKEKRVTVSDNFQKYELISLFPVVSFSTRRTQSRDFSHIWTEIFTILCSLDVKLKLCQSIPRPSPTVRVVQRFFCSLLLTLVPTCD